MRQEQLAAAFATILEARTGKHRELKPTMRLQDDLGLDSLARIDLAVAAEDAFGVMIPDEDLEQFVTVGEVLTFLERTMQ